jgi:hypothetical protein
MSTTPDGPMSTHATTRPAPPPVVARVVVFTLATVALGVGGHLAGGGRAPSAVVLAGLLAGGAVAASGMAGREQTLPRIVLAVGAIQVGIHAVLMAPTPGMHQHAGAMPGHAMVGWHAVAVLLVAWWLRRGEAAAWRLARALADRLLHPRSSLALPDPRVSVLGQGRGRLGVAHRAVEGWSGRGPPRAQRAG